MSNREVMAAVYCGTLIHYLTEDKIGNKAACVFFISDVLRNSPGINTHNV